MGTVFKETLPRRTILDTAIRSWWMAAAMFVAVVGNCTSWAGDVYVTPDGTSDGRGTKQSPVDLATATTNSQLVVPGTTVWIGPGIYQVGVLQPHESIHGTKDKPIIYRAIPCRPATVVGEIRPNNDHVWYWGLDVKGGVTVRVRSTGLKLINLTVHEAGPAEKPGERKPSGQGISGGDVGDDHEIYGNIIYHNGWNTLDHGLYVQNTVRHTAKRFVDNIVFENAGCGFHLYGQSPQLSGLYLEGNISFATSLDPRCPSNGEMNILTGGSKPITHLVLKNNCTYHPNPASKRGVDVGFRGSPNSDIRIEDNYFMCGANAMELKGAAEAVVRNNTFWAPVGMVAVKLPPVANLKVIFANNTYIDNGKFDLARFCEQIHSGTTDRLVPGKNGHPTGLHVFKRVNQYEPRRVHLAVYNWDHLDRMKIDLEGILTRGQAYRVVNVLDFFGVPVAEGKAEGPGIVLPMRGHRYEPEFGAYVLFRGDGK